MIQQVNLYLPIFRKEEKILSATAMLQSCAIIIAGLMLFYVYASWQLSGLEDELVSTRIQQDLKIKRIDELGRKYPVKVKSRTLEREVDRLNAEHEGKQRLIQALFGRSIGNTSGFSAYLEGLARRRAQGMWLTGISFKDGAANMTIKGSALRPELVPVFIQQLSREKPFSGIEFRNFFMERPKDDPARVDFTLLTEASTE